MEASLQPCSSAAHHALVSYNYGARQNCNAPDRKYESCGTTQYEHTYIFFVNREMFEVK